MFFLLLLVLYLYSISIDFTDHASYLDNNKKQSNWHKWMNLELHNKNDDAGKYSNPYRLEPVQNLYKYCVYISILKGSITHF